MTPFDRALAFTLQWEGGYINHPDDPGGETKYGISKKAYPHLDIRSLTREQAAEIYRRDYWRAARCDALPEPVAIAHFDAAVNCGVKNAAKFLQRAARVADDGVIGPVTLAAVHSLPGDLLVARMLAERLAYYLTLVGQDRRYAAFTFGWRNRVSALGREATS